MLTLVGRMCIRGGMQCCLFVRKRPKGTDVHAVTSACHTTGTGRWLLLSRYVLVNAWRPAEPGNRTLPDAARKSRRGVAQGHEKSRAKDRLLPRILQSHQIAYIGMLPNAESLSFVTTATDVLDGRYTDDQKTCSRHRLLAHEVACCMVLPVVPVSRVGRLYPRVILIETSAKL